MEPEDYQYEDMCIQSSIEPENSIKFMNNGDDVMTLNTKTAEVTWAEGVTVDDGAKCFGTAISLGAEYAAGIKECSNKRAERMLSDVISASEEKGFLTTEELKAHIEQNILIDKIVNSVGPCVKEAKTDS